MEKHITVRCKQLAEAIPDLVVSCLGRSDRAVFEARAFDKGGAESLVFASKVAELLTALETPVACIILPEKIASHAAPSKYPDKCFLIVKDIPLTMVALKSRFFSQDPRVGASPGRHATAVIDASAEIDASAFIEPLSRIGANVKIGERCWIGSFSVIEAGSVIGNDCVILPHSYIGPRTIMGKNCWIKPNSVIGSEGFGLAHNAKGEHFRIPQTGRVVLGDDVEIGSLVTLDRAALEETRIDQGSKLDNHIHIAHNCTVGAHSVIAGGAMIAGSTHIGRHNVMGGQVTITDHVKTADQVTLSGLAVVSKPVTQAGIYGGHPLQPLKDYLRNTASLVHLVEMRRDMALILKHLNLTHDESNGPKS